MTQRSRITPSGWLAIALAAYIVLFGLAYEFFRNRTKTDTPTPITMNMGGELEQGDATVSAVLPGETATTGSSLNLPGLTSTATPVDMGSYRAAIDTPTNGTVVQSSDGWVNLEGRLRDPQAGERFFVVLESPSSNPPIVYPQQEITPSADGSWQARVRFGSAGQSYRTYVIATSDPTAVSALFSHEALAGLPNGFEIVSNVSVNSMQP